MNAGAAGIIVPLWFLTAEPAFTISDWNTFRCHLACLKKKRALSMLYANVLTLWMLHIPQADTYLQK